MLELAKKKILGGKRKFSGLRYEVGCATGVLMLNQISGLDWRTSLPKPARVVVPMDSQDPETWRYALAYALKIGGAAHPPAESYILLTHTKQQLKSTALGDHVGPQVAKALLANKSVSLSNGGQLRHETLQTLRGTGRGAVIIAYFAEDKLLETLDGLDVVAGVVAVPDIAGQTDNWIARWNPIVHGQQRSETPAPLIADSVVANALKALSGWINLSHAVMNPRDKEHADETLRILRAKGHQLEPEQIKSWAIRNGWKPGAADELAKLATRIRDLKTKPSLGSFNNADGKYERWSA
ncbi:hypothetical protein CN151_23485 [Sinorhizobium meliloti]|nr:hypothetical protein [Sinorhizobium meliloti]AGA07330.1 hypothetical protein C770_GR4Chr2410 [Sinorhizobium meliloti GR4]RVK98883.1 hypothetical protein CN151_23485 [Sinorhizobium meliloti]RVN04330.1 hypothetical protein CN112_25650 [Sinorhizobium meliloti]